MTNYEIWQGVLADFELKLSKANFNTWFQHTGISEYDKGVVAVAVPNTFTLSWLEKKYHADIVKAMERVTGKPVKKIEYRVEPVKNISEYECALQEQPVVVVSSTKLPPYSDVGRRATEFGLNAKYVFEQFIVGKGNELAHAAAQAVASRPGDAYNPLFIYGGVGLGKTHLIQAIGHVMLQNNPQCRMLYVSSERFTNELVQAIKEGRTNEFKLRYRTVDLLLIDDIQFIGGKEQTQEEFFHTFNELHQQGRQVVMTSDRPPKAIPALEDRLRSRFEWGMIADIIPPDLETRAAIIQAKCQEKAFHLDDKLVNLIAATIQSNVRELEGAVNKVIALHDLKNLAATEESIRSILASFEAQNMRKSATPRDILSTVSSFFDISMDELLGQSREKKISFPRQIAMYLMRNELQLSFPAIGQEIGNRDHTTAIHADTKIKRGLESDLKLKQDIDLIKQQLYANSV